MSAFPEMYCDVQLEYPGSHIALGGFQPGCSYDYVSNSFLEGFVNYTQIVEARLLDRYRTHEENTLKLEAFMPSLDLPYGKGCRHHTNLYVCFNDDVLLLCKSSAEDLVRAWGDTLAPTWWYFWFDRDGSDCSIACFRTDDTDDVVRSNFQTFVDGLDYPNRTITPSGFEGWITY